MVTNKEDDSYRDHLATIGEDGKRVWVYPKKPKGKFYNKRKIVGYTLLAILFIMPYIKIKGEAFLLFNLAERKFVIFGQIFWPQDFYIFALAMITLVVFITFFTIIFGRVFCGWLCPQTIFMELVFRRIEYWLEGDASHQKKLNRQEWTPEKIRKKTIKHTLFWLISFLISNTFLAYIIGYEELWATIMAGPFNSFGGFLAIIVFASVFYGVFAFMREQVCTTICPYGRLQGVLMDSKSLIVAYDYKRGEGRGRFKKNEVRAEVGKGDCIDCKQCVLVCPTGIDIRNGTQLECVHCTACMDACDAIMEGVGLEKGLIRYASEDGIKDKTPFVYTVRIKVYTILLFILMGLMLVLIMGRNDLKTKIIRTRGTTFEKFDEDHFANRYDVTILNKSNGSFSIHLEIIDGDGEIIMIGKKNQGEIILEKQEEIQEKFFIVIDKDKLDGSVNFTIGVFDGEKLLEEIETTFVGPL